MPSRVGSYSSFSRVLIGIRRNFANSLRAQEQLSSGLRIRRPSDDPTGSARVLGLSRRLSESQRYSGAATLGRSSIDGAASGLEQGTNLISEARALLIQSMNGTQTDEDRRALAVQFDSLRAQLLEVGNLKLGDRFLFGGTRTSEAPWEEVQVGGLTRVQYRGTNESQFIQAGSATDIAINVPGQAVFGGDGSAALRFAGLTGVALGTTANEGSGYEYLTLRHDSTDPGTLASVGVALVGGGANDTLLGSQTLTIDATAGTIQLGSGPPVPIPAPGSPEELDVVLENGSGGQLHLDFSGFSGADFTGAVVGNGSASLDGTNFTALTFSETDLELKNEATGSVIHIDTTAVKRAGEELTTFGGTTNLFDLMQGIVEDLNNETDLSPSEVRDRLGDRLGELDRSLDNMLVSLGQLGARSQRLAASRDRETDSQLQITTLISNTRDVDFAAAALELSRSELTLQVAQSAGARLLQTTLLNFLN